MTFAELIDQVIADAWPLGVPENLKPSIESYVTTGLIEAQRWIDCFRYRHDDIWRASAAWWHCGASVVDAPRGRILRAYTVQSRGVEECPDDLSQDCGPCGGGLVKGREWCSAV